MRAVARKDKRVRYDYITRDPKQPEPRDPMNHTD
jgi:hypothetical protein